MSKTMKSTFALSKIANQQNKDDGLSLRIVRKISDAQETGSVEFSNIGNDLLLVVFCFSQKQTPVEGFIKKIKYLKPVKRGETSMDKGL